MSTDLATRQTELSFRLHEAALPFIRADWPAASERIRLNLDRLKQRPRAPLAKSWVEQWERALINGPEAIAQVALTPGERGNDLRQVSPLAGVLPQPVREQILHQVHSAAR